MNRINFSQILKNVPSNPRKDYNRLYNLFFDEDHTIDINQWLSIREFISDNFREIPFRQTCLSLNDFDKEYDFSFNQSIPPKVDEIKYLIIFCEYTFNLVSGIRKAKCSNVPCHIKGIMKKPLDFYAEQILEVVEKNGYMAIEKDGITEFVPKSPSITSVTGVVEPDVSYLLLKYNHHSLKGDIEGKRKILECLGKKLEGYKSSLSPNLQSDLFFLLNNLDIRHDNTNKMSKNYKSYIAEMDKEKLENFYDDVYYLELQAIIEAENIKNKRHEKISELKVKIGKTNNN